MCWGTSDVRCRLPSWQDCASTCGRGWGRQTGPGAQPGRAAAKAAGMHRCRPGAAMNSNPTAMRQTQYR